MSTRRCGRTMRALVLAVLVAAPVSAEDSPSLTVDDAQPPAAVTAQPEFDAIQVPSGGRPLIVTAPDAIPRQLKAAIDRASCNVNDSLLAKYPVLIFRPADGRRVMAVTPCLGITPESRAFLFERSLEREPSPMTFPVIALTGGISASAQPGLLSWEPQTRTLTAWRGSDTCPARELRHIYRQGSGDLNGFALSRIDHRQLRCTTPEAEWQTLWQSPAWKLQP